MVVAFICYVLEHDTKLKMYSPQLQLFEHTKAKIKQAAVAESEILLRRVNQII